MAENLINFQSLMHIKLETKLLLLKISNFYSVFLNLLIYLCNMSYSKDSLILERIYSLLSWGKNIDMIFSRISFFVVIPVMALLAGCSTLLFEGNSESNTLGVVYPVQQILAPETMSDLSISHSLAHEDNSMYEKGDSHSDERMTSFELPSNAIDLSSATVAGVWNFSVGDKVCRIATPQTKFGQGYRASPLHCPGIVSQVSSWAVKGKRLYFYNNSGRVIVVLYSSNIDRFEGRTLNDHPVVLSR
ncbi:Protease inhibitor Inh [Bartonella doshiae]|uniref:Protease inhibitor Inh n=3 Tax=Bartonella doshiae TaxID=33044 RepID=A0A380ZG82_BARDO|nr:hypothetical protein MCS_01056 [Bartonella doshiae NCTC 12862 = ATCC 700133]SUV45963.1 Protease inhibitor Inh [Bartonella doshiae]